MQKKRFFKARDVERFAIFPERIIGVGGGNRKIFLGKIKFKGHVGKKPKAVAVRPFIPWSGMKSARKFNKMVLRFRKAGIRVPKTWVIKHEGKLYQVIELFAKKGKTKFLGNIGAYYRFRELSMKDRQLVEGIASDYAKIFNCGYYLESGDVENYFRLKTGEETYYFIDLHSLERIERWNLQFYMNFFCTHVSLIKDKEARNLFAATFGETLKPRLLPYFEKAAKQAPQLLK